MSSFLSPLVYQERVEILFIQAVFVKRKIGTAPIFLSKKGF
jgi:hypothetical protein